jgi:hypothetical protein
VGYGHSQRFIADNNQLIALNPKRNDVAIIELERREGVVVAVATLRAWSR